ncbi:class I SAM-dependent methyltransferase [Amycolatopsis palatopharyngis]|uniref:class I SAM-dependent methyltransferase n=1 Tax=Amycolatopsis palatopharyngis TaxID=187982 RepID=UPI000E251593|nr:class I SAM-dependent methyltransferase [Amycolatopsis palatopharyngis]
MQADPSGKVLLDHIYLQPDPRAYFRTLRDFEYRIPQLAKPYFTDLIEEYRRTQGVTDVTVLDIGCSYGINSALVAHGATMDELYERYGAEELSGHPRSALLARDRDWLESRSTPYERDIRFVGLDSSGPALTYAVEAGLLDDALHADFENDEPTERQREQLTGADLVISTGCLGYVTEKTITRVLAACDGRRPWMAHFVLRMFPFDTISGHLAELGYDTVRADRVFPQRRFASAGEQTRVLETLTEQGIDTQGLEADGWFYAQLFVSRPRDRPRSQPPSAHPTP